QPRWGAGRTGAAMTVCVVFSHNKSSKTLRQIFAGCQAANAETIVNANTSSRAGVLVELGRQ
ncbi:hypothetical protein VS883_28110, partial [Escherichia coli]